MTTATTGIPLDSGRLARPTASALLDRFRTRFAASLAERRADRRFRAQERALAGMGGAQRAEVLAAARRA